METKSREHESKHPHVDPAKYVHLKFKKPKPALVVTVLIGSIILGFAVSRGFLVAATVNGSPISRLAVIWELEEQGGKQALEALISKKIIETELGKIQVALREEEIVSEIQKIREQIELQGGTFAEALKEQGLTEVQLRKQIEEQKKLEKFLANETTVTEAEIDAHIQESKETPPAGVNMKDFRGQVRGELEREKFQKAAQKWVADLTAAAKVIYYIDY